MASKQFLTNALMILGLATALLCMISMLTAFDPIGLKTRSNMALVAPDLLLVGFALSVTLVKSPDKATKTLRRLSIAIFVALFIIVVALAVNAFTQAAQTI